MLTAHFRLRIGPDCLHRDDDWEGRMLQSMNWEAIDNLARSQWRIYADLGDQVRIDAEERRRALLLDQRQWSDWEDFLSDGPLPAEPPLPVMLRRLGRASHHLALLAERQGATA